MEKTVCINSVAGCTTEGGKFHFTGKGYVCDRCYRGAPLRDGTHRLWPMQLNHLTSPTKGPVVANSLRHLRQIEAAHGCQNVAFNNNSSNWE